MVVVKCDICGTDNFDSKDMKKGKLIFQKRKNFIYIDLCPICYKVNPVIYVNDFERREE